MSVGKDHTICDSQAIKRSMHEKQRHINKSEWWRYENAKDSPESQMKKSWDLTQ